MAADEPDSPLAYDTWRKRLILDGGGDSVSWHLAWKSSVSDEVCSGHSDQDSDGERGCDGPDCSRSPGCPPPGE